MAPSNVPTSGPEGVRAALHALLKRAWRPYIAKRGHQMVWSCGSVGRWVQHRPVP
jgi:hypothetical protein